ncbi:ABC transporter ATP-binding protein [Microvirga lotononidis]|uniref:ABC-type nitrate/sulfonate/bicarbonate transport system, ATPase component n=1 Tax=Microvirga lotononidis TaxID=864069 RepID=I4YTJ0_9HYPH|nr:ABC transporter ATP-binding protein [Microvirga lotononidis]EIM27282.1 ABC-type nitrate/sulfonate/bicarbonate transport system, ATPase component [Microvirga lotononidis]WQO28546.1 ABC transporter ATP-binding protein [Microvirga lotononidis]
MMQPAPTLVSFKDVSKTFSNGVTALAGFDLDIFAGEFVSLLGPSGCGKSTVLRLIAGLAEPTDGSVAWPEARSDDHRGEIGFVFQDATLMPWANVADNVWLPLRLRGVSRRDAQDRIVESLALVGLGDFAKAYPRELSGGMRMRVSIARALSLKPRLLLMDEPFAALDEIARFRLNDDLLRLQGELRCTVVFVTHSVYESAYLSSRIAVMSPRPGRIVAAIEGLSPGPRASDFRTSASYTQLCGRISQVLLGQTVGERP